eukprot:s804_g3.t1
MSMLLWDIWIYVAYGVGVCFASATRQQNSGWKVERTRLPSNAISDLQQSLGCLDAELDGGAGVPLLDPTCASLEQGLITDVVFIQVGWAFLNIVSKFTFIFYIQRIKDNYCSRMKVKREFAGARSAGPAITNKDGSVTPPASSRKQDKSAGEMSALVVETMPEAYDGTGGCDDIDAACDGDGDGDGDDDGDGDSVGGMAVGECTQRQLPWDLVSAVQKRLKVWKLEMQDTAELALEQGEAHYQVDEEPAMLSMPGSVRGGTTPQSPVMCDDRLNRIEDTLAVLQQQSEFQADVMRRLCDQGDSKMEQAIEMTVQATLRAQEGPALL